MEPAPFAREEHWSKIGCRPVASLLRINEEGGTKVRLSPTAVTAQLDGPDLTGAMLQPLAEAETTREEAAAR